MGKFWQGKFLANRASISYWQGKKNEYGEVNKYAKYNFAISVNIDKENLGK